jgi:histidinol-phosphate phosphatase family protein
MSRQAVFLDKDGTLVRDVAYNVSLGRIELMPFAGEVIHQLSHEGYLLIIVSNQSGVGHGYFEESELAPVRRFLECTFLLYGARLHDFLYCPHHPEALLEKYRKDCVCRKPAPGMLCEAAERWGIDLERSWMVGDILNDVEAGNRAGCRTILLDSGGENEWLQGDRRTPDYHVCDWRAVSDIILSRPCLLTV